MAGDWIKMRVDLWTDPRVKLLQRLLKCCAASATGALYRLWSLADMHSEDGTLVGYDAEALDAEVGIQGFAEALADPRIGWLSVHEDTIQVVDFKRHNGQSGKRRAQAARSMATSRAKKNGCAGSATDVNKCCAPSATERQPEKININNKDNPSLCSTSNSRTREGLGLRLIEIDQKDLEGVDFDLIRAKANRVVSVTGPTSSPAERRFVLRACLLAETRMAERWLENGLEAIRAKEPKPKNPLGYLRRVLQESTATHLGADLEATLKQITIPAGLDRRAGSKSESAA